MKVEKYRRNKVRHDLLNRKNTEFVHLQRTIDQKKAPHKNVLKSQDLKLNVLKFLKK